MSAEYADGLLPWQRGVVEAILANPDRPMALTAPFRSGRSQVMLWSRIYYQAIGWTVIEHPWGFTAQAPLTDASDNEPTLEERRARYDIEGEF